MTIECEAKFALENCLDLERLLRPRAMLETPWHLESNTLYDREGELVATDRLLRLRRADGATLTYKAPAPDPSEPGVKRRLEIECPLSRPGDMDLILRGLGYLPRLCYEKFRSVWTLTQARVFLDILPFGHFLEIEASPARIRGLALELGLDPRDALSQSYHDLHLAWRQVRHLEPCADFVFTPTEKERLQLMLNCPPCGDANAHRHSA